MNVGAVANPVLLVVTVGEPVNVPLAPVPGGAKVTLMPLTGLLLASFTVTCSAVAKAVLMTALCELPAVTVTLAAGPGVFVKLKLAGVATPETLAVTVYVPAVAFAVKMAAVATPLALVVAVVNPPANVPLAPVPGAANVTTTPLTGLLPASFTVAVNWFANAVPIMMVCGVPPVAEILAGGAVVLVRLKFAKRPEALAVTV